MTTENKQTEKIKIWNGIEEYVTETNRYNLSAIRALITTDLKILNAKFDFDNVAELDVINVNGRVGQRICFDVFVDIAETCLCDINYLRLQSYVKKTLEAINLFVSDNNKVTNKNVKITTTTDKPFIITLRIYGHMNTL